MSKSKAVIAARYTGGKYTPGRAVTYHGSQAAEHGVWYYDDRCFCPDCHDGGVLDPGRIRYRLARYPLDDKRRRRNPRMYCVHAASFDAAPIPT